MPRPGLTTSQRGYGTGHQHARAHALRALRQAGTLPCARCGQPMYPEDAAHLDLDHTDDRTTYRGLAHRRCNRQHGQAVAQQHIRSRKQQPRPQRVINSQRW